MTDQRRQSKYPMISVEDAIIHVLQAIDVAATRIETEVPLMQACGRIVASDIKAADPFPSFRASIMDGYAVCGVLQPGNKSIYTSMILLPQCSYSSTRSYPSHGASFPQDHIQYKINVFMLVYMRHN